MIEAPPESIKDIYFYDPETGEFSNIQTGRKTRPSHSEGYHRVQYLGKRYFVHKVACWWNSGEWSEQVDHINRDTGDNRLVNLRPCTQQQNSCNKSTRGSSKYRGVYWHTANNKWISHGRVKGEPHYLGTFECEKEAARAYNDFAKEYHGEYASLNEV